MIRTLVVEDNPVILDVNSNYVQRVPGFALAGVARTGAEALAAAHDQPFDLVLLDFYLPDMGGLEVCRALRADRASPVDIIALTQVNDTDTVRAAFAYGVVQYLIKPYTFASFQEKLQRYAIYRQHLSDGQIISQPELDQTLNTLRGSSNIALPKHLSPTVYQLIVDVLRRAEWPLSATEISHAAGRSRRTALRYLHHLHHQGIAVLTVRYGATGRPVHLYQLNTLRDTSNTPPQDELSPKTYQLIVDVLRRAEQPLSADEIADAAGLFQCTVPRYLDYLH